MANLLSAGIGRRDITPNLGTHLFGYSGSARVATRVADGLNATALVLRSGGTMAVILSLDWCLVDEEETRAIRELIFQRTGIPAAAITVCATHTHSGPQTVENWGWGEKNREYLAMVRPNIVQAVTVALENLQAVSVGIGTGITKTGVNRREVAPDGSVRLGFQEWGPVDETMTVVSFKSKDGEVAQIVHLAAHPTARGTDTAISRDWPGVLVDRMEVVTGCPVLFLNGAFGDIAPRTMVGGIVGDGEDSVREVGLGAAAEAVAIWRTLKDFRDLPLSVYEGEVELPHAPLPSLEEADSQIEAYRAFADSLGFEACMWRHWSAVRWAHDEPLRDRRLFRQAITCLGPLVLVPFAGEAFCEISLRLRKLSPFQYTLCLGTTNGSHGYYVTREARVRGGYEVWVGRAYGAYLLADDIDDVLVRENLAILQKASVRIEA